jgi:hypothetical protein
MSACFIILRKVDKLNFGAVKNFSFSNESNEIITDNS